jgi:hypothetical protein
MRILHASTGILLGLLLTGCAASGIRVLVVNKAGRPVENLKIDYTGGSRTLERLKAGASYRTTIKLTGSSSVDVEFDLPGGEKKAEKIKAQLEPGYTGDLRLEITPEGRIGWEKHLMRTGSRVPKGSSAGGPGN